MARMRVSDQQLPASRSVVSVLVSFAVRRFSTNPRPACGRPPAAAVLGRQWHHRTRPSWLRPWLLLESYGHAVTHQHLGAVGAHHAKDDVELEAGGTWWGRLSLEVRCTRSAF